MGDEAETVFENWASKHDLNLARIGLNRPPFEFFHTLPPQIRFLPDYLCEDTKKFFRDKKHPMKYAHCFVEVKGVGKDQKLKLKKEMLKINGDLEKSMGRQVVYFFWDNVNKRVSFHHTNTDIIKIIKDNDVPEKKFHEGNAYFPVPTDLLTWSSKPVEI